MDVAHTQIETVQRHLLGLGAEYLRSIDTDIQLGEIQVYSLNGRTIIVQDFNLDGVDVYTPLVADGSLVAVLDALNELAGEKVKQ